MWKKLTSLCYAISQFGLFGPVGQMDQLRQNWISNTRVGKENLWTSLVIQYPHKRWARKLLILVGYKSQVYRLPPVDHTIWSRFTRIFEIDMWLFRLFICGRVWYAQSMHECFLSQIIEIIKRRLSNFVHIDLIDKICQHCSYIDVYT